ncbi:MAG: citrate synthase [Sedimentisphaerales bacterium]|nr:citrate synthase [Sedimentisphaerales bacterium]
MTEKATLEFRGKKYDLPALIGTENEIGLDITKFRAESQGCVTLDPGFANTASCASSITYIDGDKGILRYRGYDIEDLANNSRFAEVAYLLIWGELPSRENMEKFSSKLTDNALLHENLKSHFEGFPSNAAPMAMLSAMINALSCYHPQLTQPSDNEDLMEASARLISKVRTIAAFSYKMTLGQPFVYPDPHRRYVSNLLHMMFSVPHGDYEVEPTIAKAIDAMLMLHADHEQNCSTSTVRMVASARANLFSSIAAGVCALWGPLHGGANMAVIDMLEKIHKGGLDADNCLEMAKSKDNPFKLMGFGHRVYKNYDPRAKILKKLCHDLFDKLNHHDPLLDIARRLEEKALKDSYFVDRNLYPNVDFYSGLIMRAIGIPTNMFTVFFAIGRLPGWIAHWKEVYYDQTVKISRPRQIYTGETLRTYVPMENR